MCEINIGANIKRERKNKAISQEELGKIVGLTQQSISSFEKGLSIPEISILFLIAHALKCNAEVLLDIEPKENVSFSGELLAKNIHYYRKKSNTTQANEAKRLNIATKTLSSYENGTSEPNALFILRYVELHHIEFKDLFVPHKG